MNRGIIRQVLIGIVCNLLVIDSGFHEGWSTPMIPKFNKEDPMRVSSDDLAWVVNLMYVGVGFGSVAPLLLMDRIGRKGTLMAAAIPKIVSWLLLGLATNIPTMFVGRILAGVGCGITYSVLPMYLGEVTSKQTRGPLGTMVAVILNVGMLLSYAIGLAVSRLTMSLIAIWIPVVFALTICWLPESSIFLTKKNRLMQAEKTLQWSLGKENVESEFEEVKRMVATDDKVVTFVDSLKESYKRQQNRRAFFIALIVLSILTLSGAAPVLAYQSYIFDEAGFEVSTNLSIVMTGCAIVFTGCVCVFVVKFTGKRLLLLIAAPVCILSLSAVATFFTLAHYQFDVSGYKWVPTVFVVLYVGGFGLGLNPIPIAYIGEIFPVEVKVPAAIFGALFYAVGTTSIVKYYQVTQELYGTQTPLWTFAGIIFFVWILAYFFVPETEGKSLQEIQVELQNKK